MDHHPRTSATPLSSLSGLPVGAQHFQSLFSLPVEVSKPGLYCKGVISSVFPLVDFGRRLLLVERNGIDRRRSEAVSVVSRCRAASDHCPRYRTVSEMKDILPSSLSGLAVGAQHFQSLLSLPVEVV